MKIASWNVNGIRACKEKGFLDWLTRTAPAVACFQEIKCIPAQLEADLLAPQDYQTYWYPALKPGYSGVAIFSKIKPQEVLQGLGIEAFDSEGRVLTLIFSNFTLVTAYFPNSQRDHARLSYKLDFCKAINHFLDGLKSRGGNPVLLCGDVNIAHRYEDLANPKANENNAGFLPQERNWLSEFLSTEWTDTFRQFKSGNGHYTWWSYRPGIRERNIGWRLDYHFVNSQAKARVKRSWHDSETLGSDHCPVFLDIDVEH